MPGISRRKARRESDASDRLCRAIRSLVLKPRRGKKQSEDSPRTDLPHPGVDYLLYIGTYTSTTVFIISGANPQHRVSRDCHWEGTEIAMSAHNVSVLRKSLVHS